MKFYCGIDLGARKTHVCLIDEEDRKLLDMKMDNNLGVIESALRAYKSSLEVVAESTINWEWIVVSYEASPIGFGIYDECVAAGIECHILAPTKMPKSPRDRKRKDGRVDAQKIFELLIGYVLAGNKLPALC